VQRSRLPWEEVRDWFHEAGNYVGVLDEAAERLGDMLRGRDLTPAMEGLELYLRNALSVSLVYTGHAGLRDYDPEMGHLVIDQGQPAESQRFQLAHQLAALALREEISAVVEGARLRTAAARAIALDRPGQLCCGRDPDALCAVPGGGPRGAARYRPAAAIVRRQLRTGLPPPLHTAAARHARGALLLLPGRHGGQHHQAPFSATRLQFARFGGACPLWIVHEAVAIPDRILVQLAETPDGVRYVSMAKGLVKPSGSYDRSPRRYAVALGCEVDHAREFIYADGLDLGI
jgi:predicted transcriptional regulator